MKKCDCERVPVLCGCGWGALAMPECEVPEECPVCGFNFWGAFGCPPECGTDRPAEEVAP